MLQMWWLASMVVWQEDCSLMLPTMCRIIVLPIDWRWLLLKQLTTSDTWMSSRMSYNSYSASTTTVVFACQDWKQSKMFSARLMFPSRKAKMSDGCHTTLQFIATGSGKSKLLWSSRKSAINWLIIIIIIIIIIVVVVVVFYIIVYEEEYTA